MRVAEAKQKVKDLILVHVETIGVSGHDEAQDGGHDGSAQREAKRSEQKACLRRYREANIDIMRVIHDELPKATVEKASIDEVYIDVTELVDEDLQRSGDMGRDPHELQLHPQPEAHVFSWSSVVFGDVRLTTGDPHALRLAVGAKIASRVRGAIKTRCGFTSSAGIATNKLLAKVASALNKPNQQTLIHPSTVPRLMRQLPLRKLGGMGGKLGSEIESLVLATSGNLVVDKLVVSDIFRVPEQVIMARLGAERGGWALQLARGEDESIVLEKERTKSMLAAKSFEPLNAKADIDAIKRWLDILSSELEGRMRTDLVAYRRRAKTLVLTFRSKSKAREQSKRCEMPRFPNKEPCRRVLSSAAMDLFRGAAAEENGLVCSRLALTAQDFVELPNEKTSIKRYFGGTAVKKEGYGGRSEEGTVVVAQEKNSPDKTGDIHENDHETGHENGREHGGDEECAGTHSHDVANNAPAAADDFADIDPAVIRQQAELLKEASMLHRMDMLAGGKQATDAAVNVKRPQKKRKTTGLTNPASKMT